uniref:Uncharacterized protein n=1 Tax=Chlamydomonas leiostraca TaxID=1034604 RepID=A0A7S0WYB7_9CHLO
MRHSLGAWRAAACLTHLTRLDLHAELSWGAECLASLRSLAVAHLHVTHASEHDVGTVIIPTVCRLTTLQQLCLKARPGFRDNQDHVCSLAAALPSLTSLELPG